MFERYVYIFIISQHWGGSRHHKCLKSLVVEDKGPLSYTANATAADGLATPGASPLANSSLPGISQFLHQKGLNKYLMKI